MSQMFGPLLKRWCRNCRTIFSRHVVSCLQSKQHTPSLPTQSYLCLSSLMGQHSANPKHLHTKSSMGLPMLICNNRKEDIVLGRTYVSKKTYPFAELKEGDLEENFVRGSGPGGQSVNKTANCVVLKHIPTGLVVKCHETRSLPQNRQRARERLRERLDFHLHGNNSFMALQEQEASQRRKEQKKKNKSRLDLKKAFKDREGMD